MKCLTCGTEIPERTGRGRRSDYCCESCRRWAEHCLALSRLTGTVRFQPREGAVASGDLFAIVSRIHRAKGKAVEE